MSAPRRWAASSMRSAASSTSSMSARRMRPSSMTRRPIAGRACRRSSSPRASVAAAAVGGKIHVIGGRGVDKVTVATHEVYDPKTKAWSKAAPLPVARDHAGIAVIAGKIHVFGGRTNDVTDNVALHDVYDPATDTWRAAAPMPTARSSGAATVYRGLILFRRRRVQARRQAGRAACTYDTLEAYDPTTDTMAGARAAAAGAACVRRGDGGRRRLFRRRHDHLRRRQRRQAARLHPALMPWQAPGQIAISRGERPAAWTPIICPSTPTRRSPNSCRRRARSTRIAMSSGRGEIPLCARAQIHAVRRAEGEIVRAAALSGLRKNVIVQASCHGSDNRALVDALEDSNGTARGVAVVSPTSATASWPRSTAPACAASASISCRGSSTTRRTRCYLGLADRIEPLGWHIVVYFEAPTLERITPFLTSLPTTIVVDHMGRPDVAEGRRPSGFPALSRR